MQHRDMLPFLATSVTENERKRKIAFFVSVSKNVQDGIFRGYYNIIDKRVLFQKKPVAASMWSNIYLNSVGTGGVYMSIAFA